MLLGHSAVCSKTISTVTFVCVEKQKVLYCSLLFIGSRALQELASEQVQPPVLDEQVSATREQSPEDSADVELGE